MKLALAQINARLGDLDGICARLEQQVLLAGEAGADLLCLPAPLFSGVTPSTLVDYQNYEHDLMHRLQQVATVIESTGVACLVPVVLSLEAGPLFEVMLLRRGRVVPMRLVMIRHSEEMPVSPWSPPIFEYAGARIAVTFDLFRDISELPHGVDLVIYFPVNGFDATSRATAHVGSVGSGYTDEAKKAGMWVACMAPIGCYDEAVYTGGSFVLDDAGRVVAHAPCFEEHLLVQDVSRGMHVEAYSERELPQYDREVWLWEALRLHVRDAVEESRFGRVVVPMTGDLPSSLLAVLAVDALGSRNVFGLLVDHGDAKALADEDGTRVRRELALEVADRLHIRLVERRIPPLGILFGNEGAQKEDACRVRNLDALLLADTARSQQAIALAPYTKIDYALRANVLAELNAATLAPFGDVHITHLLKIAARRNHVSVVLPNAVVCLASIEEYIRELLRDGVSELELDEVLAQRAEEVLDSVRPTDVAGSLTAHVDNNRVLENLSLFRSSPEAAALVLLLVRCNERGRRMLPRPPIVSGRSFAERIWPVSLAWSDLGRHGAEPLRAADFADAEFSRLEKKGEERGQQARGEVLGFLGDLLGLSPEQQAELFSEESQQRMREELSEMEGNLREMFRHMAEQGGMPGQSTGSQSDEGQTPSNGFSFFSLN